MNVIGCRPDGWWRDRRAAMGALIVNHVDFTVRVAGQYHRPATDTSSYKVTGIFDLTFMSDIDPGPAKNPFHLQLEDFRVAIDPAMDPARLDE